MSVRHYKLIKIKNVSERSLILNALVYLDIKLFSSLTTKCISTLNKKKQILNNLK